ncbi:uncharacterized protein LOC120331283 isoform X2 [Styela clava]|uniref:uncharacterized protein LOC120331283 isoform X2 n=1 Tax=Styela clava TaxID=7725 RepID=UPI00193991FA|nr:uncharacterized protein LOC120331283 isoform X2 [Styela clava]
MNVLLKQRRLIATIVTITCLIYTSHVTVQIFLGLNHRQQCYKYGREAASRHVLARSINSEGEKLNIDEGTQRARETVEESKTEAKKKYRLDIIEADLEAVSKGELPDESINEVEDKTDYFGCSDFDRIPRTRKEVEENLRGNRGISFIKVRINGITIPAVMKEANRFDSKDRVVKENTLLYRTVVEEYKYNSAQREITYLRRLRGLRGIPRLLGSCVEELRIRYLVERVNGLTLCNDNGTSPECALGNHIMDLVQADPNPHLSALTFAYSTTSFFKQLEERHLFMEDVSGLNFMMTTDWQLYMVDADSLVFYNDSRIYSKVSCNSDDHCPKPSGNLWIDFSLNMRIYKNCRDLTGICEDNECRGFGTELHTCGVANWYICRLSTLFKESTNVGKIFKDVCICMNQMHPHRRCTFDKASAMLRDAFGIFIKEKASSLPT